MAYWGKVPVLDMYRQMAIRQQKQHDYGQALRGLGVRFALCSDLHMPGSEDISGARE